MNHSTLHSARWLCAVLAAGSVGLAPGCGSGKAGVGPSAPPPNADPPTAGAGSASTAPAPATKLAAAPDGTMLPILQTITRPDGLVITDLRIGEGKEVTPASVIVVHFHGTRPDGQICDTTRGGPPYRRDFRQVIKGWQLGLAGMKVGGIRRLTVPPELAYGAKGTPNGSVPPNATLTFSIQLIDVIAAPRVNGER